VVSGPHRNIGNFIDPAADVHARYKVSRLDRTGQTVSADAGEIPPLNLETWFNLREQRDML